MAKIIFPFLTMRHPRGNRGKEEDGEKEEGNRENSENLEDSSDIEH